jgi:hypothetical protein
MLLQERFEKFILHLDKIEIKIKKFNPFIQL